MNISHSLNIESDLGLNVNSDIIIEMVSEFKLKLIIDKYLPFSSYVDSIYSCARSRLNALRTPKHYGVKTSSLLGFYLANVRSVLCYAAPVWFSYLSDTSKNRPEPRICPMTMSENYLSCHSICGQVAFRQYTITAQLHELYNCV